MCIDSPEKMVRDRRTSAVLEIFVLEAHRSNGIVAECLTLIDAVAVHSELSEVFGLAA